MPARGLTLQAASSHMRTEDYTWILNAVFLFLHGIRLLRVLWKRVKLPGPVKWLLVGSVAVQSAGLLLLYAGRYRAWLIGAGILAYIVFNETAVDALENVVVPDRGAVRNGRADAVPPDEPGDRVGPAP